MVALVVGPHRGQHFVSQVRVAIRMLREPGVPALDANFTGCGWARGEGREEVFLLVKNLSERPFGAFERVGAPVVACARQSGNGSAEVVVPGWCGQILGAHGGKVGVENLVEGVRGARDSGREKVGAAWSGNGLGACGAEHRRREDAGDREIGAGCGRSLGRGLWIRNRH